VSVGVPVDHEFLLDYWLSLPGSDETRLHFYPKSNNKKRRHQRDRRENQWIELSPAGTSSDSAQKTAHQPFPCSRNAFGGIHNSTESSAVGDNQVSTFHWFLKANPYPLTTFANVVFRWAVLIGCSNFLVLILVLSQSPQIGILPTENPFGETGKSSYIRIKNRRRVIWDLWVVYKVSYAELNDLFLAFPFCLGESCLFSPYGEVLVGWEGKSRFVSSSLLFPLP